MRLFLSVLFLSSMAAPTFGEDKVDAVAQAQVVAPFVDEQTFALVRVDVARLDLKELGARLTRIAQVEPSSVASSGLDQPATAFVKAGGKDLYFVFSLTDVPYSFFVLAPFPEGKEDAAVLDLLGALGLNAGQRKGAVIVAAPRGALKAVLERKAAARPEIVPAFTAAGDGAVQAIFIPPVNLRQAFKEVMPELPPMLGGGSTQPLSEGFLWAAVGMARQPKMALRLTVQAKDAAHAERLHGLLGKAAAASAEDQGLRRGFPWLKTITPLLVPKVAGDQLVLTVAEDSPPVVALLRDLLPQAQQNARRAQTANSLKQVGLALHVYHDVHAAFPPAAILDNQGKPLLSWRVAILPYLDEDKLYKEFKLDEPWDSEHNRTLIARMPAVFRSGKKAGERTGVVALVGKDATFTGGPKGVSIREMTDGTSNTLLAIEADEEHAVVWTKPEDLKAVAKDLRAGVASIKGSTFAALFGDGAVRSLPKDLDLAVLAAVITRNGGEVVKLP